MAQPAGPAHFYPSTLVPNALFQVACDEINELKAPLIAIGVPDNIFNSNAYNAEGYSTRSVVSYLKLFSAYPDQDQLEQVLNIGITKGFFTSISSLTAASFFHFCGYLQTPAGKTALAEVARQKRVMKEPSDVALVKMFEAQGTDYANAVVEAMREHEAKIECLKKEYAPYATYNDINDCDLNASCWEEFIRKYYEDGSKHPSPTSPTMDLVVQSFSPTVRNKHKLNYINEGDNKKKLVEYGRRTNTGLNIRDSEK